MRAFNKKKTSLAYALHYSFLTHSLDPLKAFTCKALRVNLPAMKNARLSVLAILLIALFSSACSSTRKTQLEKLAVGMEKPQVIDLVGGPHKKQRKNSIDIWIYFYYVNEQRFGKKVFFREGFVKKIKDFNPEPNFEDDLDNSENFKDYEQKIKKSRKKSKELQP